MNLKKNFLRLLGFISLSPLTVTTDTEAVTALRFDLYRVYSNTTKQ